MIIQISLASNINDMLSYNKSKVEASTADNLIAKVIATSVPLDENALMYFRHAGERNKNPNLKLRYAHVKVAVDRSDNLTDYAFYKLGLDVMEGLIGINRFSTPYIIYRHYDKEESNPHIHIIHSRTDYYGRTNPFKHYKYQAMKLSRTLEIKYGLTSALNKNLDKKNGIKEFTYETDRRERKDDMQSQFQHIRDIVSAALTDNESFEGYIKDLAMCNVSVSIRVEKDFHSKLKVGISYGLNAINPEVKIVNPSIPTRWKFNNEPEAIRELAAYGFTTSENRMYYLNSANQAMVNDSHYFAHEFKNFNISARKLGPGAGWYNLKKKFDVNEDTNEELLAPFLNSKNRLLNKRNVWVFNASEMFPKESLAEQKLALSIKKHNPGYLLEAINLGVDFLAFLAKRFKRLKRSQYQKIRKLVTLQTHLTPQQITLSNPIVKQRYLKALNIDFRIVEKEEAFNYAVGFITQDVSTTAYDIKHPQEIEKKVNNIKLLDVYIIQKDLLYFLKLGKQKMLEIALRHPKVEFKILIPELNYELIKKHRLSDDLVESLEVRISKEQFFNPADAVFNESLIAQHIMEGNDILRYLTKMQNVDFSKTNVIFNGIKDPALREAVKRRINKDRVFLPQNVVNFQRELDRSIARTDTSKMISFLEMSMLDFSKVTIQSIKHLFPPNDFQRLSKRIEKDKIQTEKLALFREGQMEVDHKTNSIIPIRVPIDGKQYRLDKEKEYEREHAIELNSKPNQDKGLSL